jgi:hypothetical protein
MKSITTEVTSALPQDFRSGFSLIPFGFAEVCGGLPENPMISMAAEVLRKCGSVFRTH